MSNTNGNAGGNDSDLPPGWTVSISKSQPDRMCYQHVNGRRMFRRPTAADDTRRQPPTTPAPQPNATGLTTGATPVQGSNAPSPASGRGPSIVVASMPLTSVLGTTNGRVRTTGFKPSTSGTKSVTAVLPDLSTAGRPLVSSKPSQPPPPNDLRQAPLSGLEQPAKHRNASKPSQLPTTNDTRQAPLLGLEQPAKHGNSRAGEQNALKSGTTPTVPVPSASGVQNGNTDRVAGVGEQKALKSGTTPTAPVPSASGVQNGNTDRVAGVGEQKALKSGTTPTAPVPSASGVQNGNTDRVAGVGEQKALKSGTTPTAPVPSASGVQNGNTDRVAGVGEQKALKSGTTPTVPVPSASGVQNGNTDRVAGVGEQKALKSGTTLGIPSGVAEKPIGTIAVTVTTQSTTKEQPRAASPQSPSRAKVAALSAESAVVPPSTPNTKETSATPMAVSTPSPSKPQQPRSGSRIATAAGPKPSPSKLRAAVTSEDLAEFEFGSTDTSQVKTTPVARNLEVASSLGTHDEKTSDDAKKGSNRHDVNPLNLVLTNEKKIPIDANPMKKRPIDANPMGKIEKKTPNGGGQKATNEDGNKASGGERTESSTVKSEEPKKTIDDSNKPASDGAILQVNKAIKLESSQTETTKSSSAPTASKVAPQTATVASQKGPVVPQHAVAPQPVDVASQPTTAAPQPADVASQPTTAAPQPAAVASQPTTAAPQPAAVGPVPPVKVTADHPPRAASGPVPLPKAAGDNNPPAGLGPVPSSVPVPPSAGTGASVGPVAPSKAGGDSLKVVSVGPVPPSKAGGADLPPPRPSSAGPVRSKMGGADLPPPRPSSAGPVSSNPVRSSSLMTRRNPDSRVGRAAGRQDEYDSRRSRRDRSRSRDRQRNKRSRSSSYRRGATNRSRDRGGRPRDKRRSIQSSQQHHHRGPSPVNHNASGEGNRSIQSSHQHHRGPSPLPPTNNNATTEASRGPPVAIPPQQLRANLQPPQLVYPTEAQSHLQQQLHIPTSMNQASTTQSRTMPVYAPPNFSNQATTIPPAASTSSMMRTTVYPVHSGGGAPAYVPSMPSYTPIVSPTFQQQQQPKVVSTTSLVTSTNRSSEPGGPTTSSGGSSSRSLLSNGETGLASASTAAAAAEIPNSKRLREDVPMRPRVEIVAARTTRRQRNMEANPVPADSLPIVAHGATSIHGKMLLSSLTETMQTLQIPNDRRTNIIAFVQKCLQIASSSSVFVLRPPPPSSPSSLGTIPTVALDSINKVKEFLGLLSDEEAVVRVQRLGDANDDEQVADDAIGNMTGRYPIGFQRDEPLEIPMLREAWMCRVIEDEMVTGGDSSSSPVKSVVFIVEMSKSKTELGRGTSPIKALRAALNNSRFSLRRKQLITKPFQKQDDEKFGCKGTEATRREDERATGKFHVDLELIADDSSASTQIKVRRLRFYCKEAIEQVLMKGDEGQEVGALLCPGDVVTVAGDKEYTYVSDEDIVKHAPDLIWFTFQPSFEWFSPFEELMSLLDSTNPETRSLLHSLGGLSLDCVELDVVEGEIGHELFGMNLERVSMTEARLKSKSSLRCFTSQLVGVDLTIAFVTKKIREAMETLHAKLRWMAESNLFEPRDATVWGEMFNDQLWFPQAVLLGDDDHEANQESNAVAAVDESANVSSGEDPLAVAAPPEEVEDVKVLSDNELRQLMEETIFQSALTRGGLNASNAASFFPAVIAEMGLLSVESSLNEEQWRNELQKAFDQRSPQVDLHSIRSILRRPITVTTLMRDLREAYPHNTIGSLVAMLHHFYRSLLGPDTSKKTEAEEKSLGKMTCSEIRERILKGHERALEVYSLQGLEGRLKVLNGLYVISDTANDLKVFTFVGSMDGNNADDQLDKIQDAFVGQCALFHFVATGVWALQRKDKQRMSDCLCVGQIGADFSSQQWVCATQESRQSPTAMLPAPAVKLARFSLPDKDI